MKILSICRRFVLIGVWLVSCGAAVAQSPPPVPPTVTLTSPTNGATFVAPANILLTAVADDSD
ncbi:MAG TPA: Ig-like domain-containing protein, partial [Candidatus Dormibacteraeota bacterium]|nr:Ig-like domain-containing protein [Candidatus Dormibacteraeota bacterium]